jgi:hypothetical protein
MDLQTRLLQDSAMGRACQAHGLWVFSLVEPFGEAHLRRAAAGPRLGFSWPGMGPSRIHDAESEVESWALD